MTAETILNIDSAYLYTFLLAYVLGSIPFGLITGYLGGIGDIQKQGSGNIGATNMLRVGGRKLAFITLVLDMGKAVAAVYLCSFLFNANPVPNMPFLSGVAALAVVIGHCFPVWLRFKGGKGVATGLGAYIAIDPLIGSIFCLIWLVMAVIFKISSLSAIAVFIAAPIVLYLTGKMTLFYYALAISLLIIYRHKENIHNLLTRQEGKIKL